MQIFGKILGAFFGLLLGGPFGLLLGLFIGHQFDKARRLSQAGFSTGGFGKGPSQAQRQEEFFKAAFAVMGHVAKAKGQVTKEEIQLASAMMERMNLHGEQRRAAQDAFREGKESDFPLDDVLMRVKFHLLVVLTCCSSSLSYRSLRHLPMVRFIQVNAMYCIRSHVA